MNRILLVIGHSSDEVLDCGVLLLETISLIEVINKVE